MTHHLTERDAASLVVSPVVVPERLDAPDARGFLELVRIGNDVCRHDAGHDDLDQDATEVLGSWQDAADWTHAGFAAAKDGIVIGAVGMVLANGEDQTTAEFDLMVDPPRWGEGAEEILLAAAEDAARAHGRSTVQTWTLHRAAGSGPMLRPPTGLGAIPAADRQAVLLQRHGYSLEQVERTSALDLHGPLDLVAQALEDALAVAGDDYRPVVWTSPTPEEHLDTFAYALSRMDTDAPQGGLLIEQQHWDADRVRRRDARREKQGLTVSVAAVRHAPTGAIVAYNELAIGADRTGATQQHGTLVLEEHRGHRLGTVVKCANLLRWRELVPESPRVVTFNAEENRPMLDINERIGFVPVSSAAAWQKRLS